MDEQQLENNGPPPPKQSTVDTVPYSRFQQVVSEKGTLRAEVDSLKLEIQTLSERGATVDTVTRELEVARTKIATMGAETDLNMALAERGFDADGRSIIKMLHGNLPEEGRPSALAWVDGMKEDPTARPKPLLGYFDAQSVSASPETPAPKAKPKLPRASRHASTTTDPSSDVTAEQLKAARIHGEKTGDWSKSKELIGLVDAPRP